MNSRSVCSLPGKRFCWVSGIQQKPAWWHAPWFLQAAHLGAGSGSMMRVDDIRMVNCLCPLLHDLHVDNSDRLPKKTIGTHVFPTIDNGNMLWIKQRMDPENWDPDFIASKWKGNPPDPKPPSRIWIEQMALNQGIRWKN